MKFVLRKMEHYGLIAAMCDEHGIVEQINRMVGYSRRKVSVGHGDGSMPSASPLALCNR